jgi:hypothetical protein
MMDAAFICHKRDCNQDEHHDEDDALFIFSEFENSEQAFHLSVVELWIF